MQDTSGGAFFEEDIAATNPQRTEQVRELERYLRGLRDSTDALRKIFQPDYSSERAFIGSTRKLRSALAETLGYPPPGKTDNVAPVFQRIGDDAIAVYYRIRIPVLPGVNAFGLYLTPKNVNGKVPLVISQHGGGGSPEVALFHGGANYHDMVRGAASNGYAVLALQHLFAADGYPGDIRQRMDSRARLAGTTITGIEIAKITRSLDVILQRPEIDRKRVAMVGLSYGGYYTLYTTALEPRIKVAVASCEFGDSLEMWEKTEPYGWGDGRFMNLLTLFRSPEIAALICPRPLEIQMGERDDLIPIAPGREAAKRTTEYYRKLGIPDRFRFVAFSGGHEWHGQTAWEFLKRHL